MTIQFALSHHSAAPDAAGILASMAQDALSVYRDGSEVYGQGELSGPLYLIEFGCVRVGRVNPEGHRYVCGFCFAGDVFGWESEGEHQFFAEAVGATGVRVLRPNRDADAPAKLYPVILQSMKRFQEHLLVLAKHSADARLAAFICDLADRQGDETQVYLPMQRTDMADYLGLTIETVSRALRRLKDTGLITVPNSHSIAILDPAGLQEVCD